MGLAIASKVVSREYLTNLDPIPKAVLRAVRETPSRNSSEKGEIFLQDISGIQQWGSGIPTIRQGA
jgi:hypothetical protein